MVSKGRVLYKELTTVLNLVYIRTTLRLKKSKNKTVVIHCGQEYIVWGGGGTARGFEKSLQCFTKLACSRNYRFNLKSTNS